MYKPYGPKAERFAYSIVAIITKAKETIREHNNFARRVPVLEEQMKVANHRIEDLEDANKA